MNNWDKLFFSRTKPNLISSRTLKKIEKSLNVADNQSGGSFDFLNNFYKNYIEDNLFVVILISFFVIFLIYKYYNKQNNVEENFRPTMNPSADLEIQNSYGNYVGDDVPAIYNNKIITGKSVNPLPEVPKSYLPITNYIEERDSYVGYNNPYKNTADPNFPHPYEWDQHFNTSTESAIEFASEKNKVSLRGVEGNSRTNGDLINKSNWSVYDMPFDE
jgi:hypothetical protein